MRIYINREMKKCHVAWHILNKKIILKLFECSDHECWSYSTLKPCTNIKFCFAFIKSSKEIRGMVVHVYGTEVLYKQVFATEMKLLKIRLYCQQPKGQTTLSKYDRCWRVIGDCFWERYRRKWILTKIVCTMLVTLTRRSITNSLCWRFSATLWTLSKVYCGSKRLLWG